LAGVGDAAADGDMDAATKARLANAASAVLRPTLEFESFEFMRLSLILKSSVRAQKRDLETVDNAQSAEMVS
jgi:hypothetical protein